MIFNNFDGGQSHVFDHRFWILVAPIQGSADFSGHLPLNSRNGVIFSEDG